MTGPANLTKITFKIIQEPATRLAALESSEADFIDDVPPSDYNRLKDDGNFTMVEMTQPGHGWSLMMNVQRAPTDDLQVRKAIALNPWAPAYLAAGLLNFLLPLDLRAVLDGQQQYAKALIVRAQQLLQKA